MKKITILFVLIFGFTFAQNPTNYLEVSKNNLEGTTNAENSRDAIPNEIDDIVQIIDTYTTLGDFNTAISNCSVTTLVSEDFANGATEILNCGPSVSSAGDGCFAAGELEAGFTVISSNIGGNGSNVVNIPPGFIGNVDSLVGAFQFVEYTIINFSPDVYAVAMDIWENIDPTTTVRIFGAGGALIGSFDVSTPIDTQTFFGVIADEPITSIELEGLNDSGELFGNLLFGADCMNLSVEENIKDLVRIFPNPVNDNLFIKMPARITVNNIEINDILGKSIHVDASNDQINTSQLESGVYFITINTTQGKLTKKFIKK